jgi:GNAT superfamily N-acetyltransferase
MTVTKKDIATAIRRTYKDDSFWDLMVNRSKAQSGPFDGGCLVVAQALVEAFPGAELVRMVSPLNGGQTEHYGARIGKYLCDFYGPFDTPKAWIDNFVREESIRDRALSFAEGSNPQAEIVDDPETSSKVAALLKEHMPEPPSITKAQAKAFHAIVIQDAVLGALRAKGLEFDLMATTEGLEISSIHVPKELRGQGLASNFLKRITELADQKSTPLVLEVGHDEAGIGLMDWYERHGFVWADGCMERLPKAEPQSTELKSRSLSM